VHEPTYWDQKIFNVLQTILLLGAMGLLLGFMGWVLAGGWGLFLVAGFGLGLVVFTPSLSHELAMRLTGGVRLDYFDAPDLTRMVAQLAASSGLPAAPTLYYLPSHELNAFTAGTKENAGIALSTGLLQQMNSREMVGVLAHEISHIRNNDVRVMAMAGLINRITNTLSIFGQFMLLINLPILLFEGSGIPWSLVFAMIFAPNVMTLLQLALSRTREFHADLEATRLTGDPLGLASALGKMERQRGRFWERLLHPISREPSWLRTHPKTQERIDRLMELAAIKSRSLVAHHPAAALYLPRRERILGLSCL